MKINPLNENILLRKIEDNYNIFFIYGNNFGLIDICYSDLKKNLKIDLENPFTTNYFDEDRLLNNTQLFFDELYSICLFGEKKTIIVDTRQGHKKKDIFNVFNDLDLTKIKETQIIFISYMFKQTDQLTKKILTNQNVISFPCYEENEYKLESKFKSEIAKMNLKLSDTQIFELTNKLSKDTKVRQNTFEKIKLYNMNENLTYNHLLNLIDDDNNRTLYEMIDKLLTGNYRYSTNLLSNFEKLNTSTISILYLIKSKLRLLKKCLNMKQSGFTRKDILNDKSLKIFYSEKDSFLKMIDIWTLKTIDQCLFYLFKTELNCKSKKEYEYIFLNQLFIYIYYRIKN